MKKILIPILLWSIQMTSTAQSLDRCAFLGTSLEPVTSDIARVMHLKDSTGALVNKIIPKSTAEAAGLMKGDIIVKVDDKIIHTPAEAVAEVRNYTAGQTLSYTIYRQEKTITQKVTIKGLPKEEYPDLGINYSAIKAGNNILRTIITQPKKAGKLPAILFIQGVGCYSMDSPFDTSRSDIALITSLTRAGYLVMRVDKSGVGDSKGIPCDQLDFLTELNGYKQAYAAMRQMPDVDSNQCFIIGHSMGGVMAPLIGREQPVKGVIAYGTIGVNFMQYWINTRKTIAEAYSMNLIETDDYIKEQCQCASMMLDACMTKDEVIKINPNCAEVVDMLLMRDYDFWYQLYEQNIPNNWKEYNGKVLTLWGNADYISARDEHRHIADVVNEFHPGNGTFKIIPGASHSMQIAGSFSEARVNPGGFNTAISDTMNLWLKQQLN